ncbi:MAG: hypothetical protein AB1422_08785, partial [bacterium]
IGIQMQVLQKLKWMHFIKGGVNLMWILKLKGRRFILALLTVSIIMLSGMGRYIDVDGLRFKPSWKPDDWWIVKSFLAYQMPERGDVRPSPIPEEKRFRVHRFDVIGLEKVDKEKCYVVKLQFVRSNVREAFPEEPFTLLYYREKDLTLRKIVPYTKEGKRVIKINIFGKPCEVAEEYDISAPVLRDYVDGGGIPLSFPRFDLPGTYTAPRDIIKPDRPGVTFSDERLSDQNMEIIWEEKDNKKNEILKITLSRDNVLAKRQFEVVQHWVQGKPWWIYAKEIWDDGVRCESILLEYGDYKDKIK